MARGRRHKNATKQPASSKAIKAGADDEVVQLEARIRLEAPVRGTIPGSAKQSKKSGKPESADQPTLATASKFEDLPLSQRTLRGLKTAAYTDMTAIQRAAIPHLLAGRDVLGAAKTGSGKTLAFTIPLLESLFRSNWDLAHGLGAMVISPTRELALQIFDVIRKVGRYHQLSAGLVIGGKDLEEEQSRIHQMNVLVCTPGRMLQHLDQTAGFQTDDVQMLVLDEADRCLDMGFRASLDAILGHLPPHKQIALFSATMPNNVKELARLSMKQPEWLSVHSEAKSATPDKLAQSFMVCELQQKMSIVWGFIKTHLKQKSIIFLSTCKQVRFWNAVFSRLRPGLPLMCLYGKQKQMKRLATFYKFCDAPAAVLFATDIAARGLDFPVVDWVVQNDCPEDVSTYIHRAGRTARLSATGKALLLLLPSEVEFLKLLQTAKITLKRIRALTQDNDLKENAQKALMAYLRSYQMQKNKDVFQIKELPIAEFALSLGLASAPQVNFGKKTAKKVAAPVKAESEEEESDSDDDLLQVQRPNHELEEGDEESEEELEPAPSAKLKKLKVDKYSGVSKQSTATKVMFDDDGNSMTAFEKIAQGSANAETKTAADRIASVKRKIREADVEDLAVMKKRLKDKRREIKNKLKGRADGSESDVPEMEEEYESEADGSGSDVPEMEEEEEADGSESDDIPEMEEEEEEESDE